MRKSDFTNIFVGELSRASSGRFRGDTKRPRRLFFWTDRRNPNLWPDKDFVRTCVENKPTVRDFRAVKLLMRRIWASDDARAFMGISFANGVSSVGCRILLRSFLLSDRRCHGDATRSLRSRRRRCASLACARRWSCVITSASPLSDRRVGEN